MRERRKNRRDGTDPLIKITNTIGNLSWVFVSVTVFFSWVLVFFIYIFTQVVNDPVGIFVNGNRSFTGREAASKLFGFSFYALLFVFALSSIGLILNSLRHHRQTDKYNKSLIALVILSLLGLMTRLFINF